MDKLHEKIDKIHDRLGAIDITLARNTDSLVEHVRRTELLEDSLKPIQKHVSHAEGALKLVGFLSILAGITLAIFKIFN